MRMRFPIPETVFGLLIAFALAAIVASILRRFVRRGVKTLEIASAESRAALQAREQRLTRATTYLAFSLVTLVAGLYFLERYGVTPGASWTRQRVEGGLLAAAHMLVIIMGATVVIRAAHLVIEHFHHTLVRRHAETDLEWQRRSATLSGILTRAVSVSVAFVAILMVLRELSIDVLPILTTAGIAGLAIGFGAQNLVRDIISGFFLILEDQVRVGDTARINGVAGSVEHINLRTIVLRDGEGAVQVFPNGMITTLANLSKQFAFAVVDVPVSIREDIDHVFQTIRNVGNDFHADPKWSHQLLGSIEIAGVESMDARFATVRMRYKTLPLTQGAVANELRRRVLTEFGRQRIRPFGHAE